MLGFAPTISLVLIFSFTLVRSGRQQLPRGAAQHFTANATFVLES